MQKHSPITLLPFAEGITAWLTPTTCLARCAHVAIAFRWWPVGHVSRPVMAFSRSNWLNVLASDFNHIGIVLLDSRTPSITNSPHHHAASFVHGITPSHHHTITPSLHHTILPSHHRTITPSRHHTIKVLRHHSSAFLGSTSKALAA